MGERLSKEERASIRSRLDEFLSELEGSNDMEDQFQAGYYVHHEKIGRLLDDLDDAEAERDDARAAVDEVKEVCAEFVENYPPVSTRHSLSHIARRIRSEIQVRDWDIGGLEKACESLGAKLSRAEAERDRLREQLAVAVRALEDVGCQMPGEFAICGERDGTCRRCATLAKLRAEPGGETEGGS